MKKGHRTVFQNPWSQNNQHFHLNNNSVRKKVMNSSEKKATEPSSKMPEEKKPTLSLKKQFCFRKAYITESAYIEYGIGNLTIFTAFQELKKHT